jgi:predicted Zn-ribbon and HTH transcriptional regulator
VLSKPTRYWPTNVAFVFALGLNNSQHVFRNIKLVHAVPSFRSHVPAAYVNPRDCHSCCFRFSFDQLRINDVSCDFHAKSFWTSMLQWYLISLNLKNVCCPTCDNALHARIAYNYTGTRNKPP